MDKLKSRIVQTDFRKFFKWFIIVSLAVIIIGAVITGIVFRTQISEGISYMQMYEHGEDQWTGQTQDGGHHDGEWDDRLDAVPFTPPSTGAWITAGVFGVLCVLIAVVYWLAVVAWLYKAAAVSNMNRLLWPLAGLVGNLLAVALFLAARCMIRRECPSCGYRNTRKAAYCVKCGAKQGRKCPYCGTECAEDDLYCPSCGKELE